MSATIGEITRRLACLGDIPSMQHCDGAYADLWSWRTKDFKSCIRDDDMKCVVVEAGGMFAGYMISEEYVSSVEIWRLVIDKTLLRCGIGSYLVRTLCDQLMLPKHAPFHKLRNIIVDVPEDNLRAQLFFKSLGFRAKLPIVRDDIGDFYRFTYELFGGRKSC